MDSVFFTVICQHNWDGALSVRDPSSTPKPTLDTTNTTAQYHQGLEQTQRIGGLWGIQPRILIFTVLVSLLTRVMTPTFL